MISKIFFILLIVSFQFMFLDHVESRYFKIDLVIITVIYFSIKEGSMVGQVIGFITGLIQDAIQLQFLGLNMLSLTIIGFLTGSIKNKMDLENHFIKFSFIFFSIILREVINYFNYIFILNISITISYTTIFSLITSSIFNGLISYVIFFILNKKFKGKSIY